MMLSAGALAALGMMTLVGTSVAAASANICSTDGVGDACGLGHGERYTTNIYGASTGISVATLTSGFARVECPSTAGGEVLHEGALKMTALSFTVASCKSTLGPCTVAKATGLPWKSMTAVTTTAPNGRLEVKNTIGGEFTCGGINCQYSAASAGTKGEITITGGEPAKLTASKVPMSKIGGSGFCSATAEWDGVYAISTPGSLFLT
jgi:hypothetical protein